MEKYCKLCGKFVAELAPGTIVRKGTIFICKNCWEKDKDKGKDDFVELLRKLGLEGKTFEN
jgi:hypothetical protein